MQSNPPLTDASGEVRELNSADFAAMRPASEMLPALLGQELAAQVLQPKGGRPRKTTALKVSTTIRFYADVLDALKASGKGWQTRVNDLVRDWVKSQRA